MLAVLLCLFSGTALKLSDPAHLRAEVEENVSLKAWCVGVGCVQPFTPASCLSWCDWNKDKQSDAETRGAFAGKHWGKAQTKVTEFGFYFGNSCAGNEKLYHFTKNGDPFKKKAWIFPGGDAETKLETTEIQCNKCFLVSQVDGSRVFIRLTKEGGSNKLSQWAYNGAWAGDQPAMCTCDEANVFDLAPGLSTVSESEQKERANTKKANKCIGLKNLIWPKACPADPAAVAPAVCGKQANGDKRLQKNTARCAGACDACTGGSYAASGELKCYVQPICGNFVDGKTTRLQDATLKVKGKCADCPANTWAANSGDTCAAWTKCGAQKDGKTRLSGNSAKDQGSCDDCSAGMAANPTDDCV